MQYLQIVNLCITRNLTLMKGAVRDYIAICYHHKLDPRLLASFTKVSEMGYHINVWLIEVNNKIPYSNACHHEDREALTELIKAEGGDDDDSDVVLSCTMCKWEDALVALVTMFEGLGTTVNHTNDHMDLYYPYLAHQVNEIKITFNVGEKHAFHIIFHRGGAMRNLHLDIDNLQWSNNDGFTLIQGVVATHSGFWKHDAATKYIEKMIDNLATTREARFIFPHQEHHYNAITLAARSGYKVKCTSFTVGWEDSTDEICSICQLEIGSDIVTTTTCSHTFHSTCIFTWWAKFKKCPNCRRPC